MDKRELRRYFEDGKLFSRDYILRKIDQLDEHEVLSSDWIKDNQLVWPNIHGSEYYVPSNELYGKLVPKQEEANEFDRILLKHIHDVYEQYGYDYLPGFINDIKDGLAKLKEPEKPVVPEFVEKRINYCPFCGERIIHHGE